MSARLEFFPEAAVQPRVNETNQNRPVRTPPADSVVKKTQTAALQKKIQDPPSSRHGPKRTGPRRLFTLASNDPPTVSPTVVAGAFKRAQSRLRQQL